MVKCKNGLRRLLAWILAACLLLGLAACGEDQGKETEGLYYGDEADEDSDCWEDDEDGWLWDGEDDYEIQPVNPNAQRLSIGESVQDYDLKITYIGSGEFTDYNEFNTPGKGMKYIYLRFAVENTADSGDMSISTMGFYGFADGKNADNVIIGSDDLNGTVCAGRYMVGSVYFEVPEDTEKFEAEYYTNIFLDETVFFVYEGEQQRNYQPHSSTPKYADAIQKGGAMQVDNWEITLVDSFWENTENGYYSLKEGYRVLTCRVEVKNLSDSQVYVSEYDFCCYADGGLCKAPYLRSDTLGESVEPGESAVGTITFVVPQGAGVLEVEFCPFDQTSQRVVLNVMPK